jgi:hypothetical protein
VSASGPASVRCWASSTPPRQRGLRGGGHLAGRRGGHAALAARADHAHGLAYLFISGYVTLGFGGYLHAVTGLPPLAGAVGVIAACLALDLLRVRSGGGDLVIAVASARRTGDSVRALENHRDALPDPDAHRREAEADCPRVTR